MKYDVYAQLPKFSRPSSPPRGFDQHFWKSHVPPLRPRGRCDTGAHVLNWWYSSSKRQIQINKWNWRGMLSTRLRELATSTKWQYSIFDIVSLYKLLAECPLCYCEEIRQMFTFHESLSQAWSFDMYTWTSYKKLLFQNLKSSPRLEPRKVFGVCDLSSCNLLVQTNNSVLCAVLLLCLLSKLQKPSSPGLEPRLVFGVVAVVPVIPSSKQPTSVLPTIFCRA
jgi:hypothetical protein